MKRIAFDAWMRTRLDAVEAALGAHVRADAPAGLGLAMRYGVLDGGKRLRPLLVLAAAQAVGGHAEAAMRAACAVELIHAYSLIHDDMPCMDNDVLRRGKPTVHVQFGEAHAMLAGDAMQALAFEVLTPPPTAAGDVVPDALQARLCRLLARASGVEGMAGGQAIDLASVGQAAERDRTARHARPQDRRTAAEQRPDGGRLRPSVALDLGGAVRLRRRPRLWLSRWSTTSSMSPRIRACSARPPARTPTRTSPPTSRCSGWTAHATAPPPCTHEPCPPWPPSGLADVDALATLADRILDRDS